MNPVEEDIKAIGRLAVVPTILEVMLRTTGLRFSTVARVTPESWTACAVNDGIDFGLKPGGELPIATTICNEVRQQQKAILFSHASENPDFADHPVPKLYGFESYVAVPIVRTDGRFFGTLCGLDPLPVALDDPNILKTLELFAQLIATNLDIDEQIARNAKQLAAAHDAAKLREQFIAVLGHDLRSPLQSVSMVAEVLEKKLAAEPRSLSLVGMIRRSCLRMSGLIEDILDFSRGKLGGGIPVTLTPTDGLTAVLQHVVSEVRSNSPDRDLRVSIELPDRIVCDAPKLSQLLTNLLQNAVTHGAPDQPVSVDAKAGQDFMMLSVTNGGTPIPEAILQDLFEPFVRASDHASSNGLGLGLYIASEIARGHSGTLSVSSEAESGTCFVFRMPLRDS